MIFLNGIIICDTPLSKNINCNIFKYLKNLTYLNLSYTKNFKYECLKNIITLKTLFLAGTNIINLKSLSKLIYLEKLNISELSHNELINLLPLTTLGKKNKLNIYIYNSHCIINEDILSKNPNIKIVYE
jgi:hypothetical protein